MPPFLPSFQAAIKRGDAPKAERMLSRIKAGGWRSFPATGTRSNARASYAYLAKAEGRKQWGSAPTDSTPLPSDGVAIIDSSERCASIAKASYKRLQAPATLHPGERYPNPDDHVLGRLTERIQGVLAPVCPGEIR